VGGVLRASVDAFTPDERFENGLASKLSVTGPEPKGDTAMHDLAQVAPGRYEAQIPLDRYGSFLLKAEHFREQPDGSRKLAAVSYGHLSNPYPPELATFEPNRALLERVATAGGGAVDPKGLAAVLDPAGEKVTYREELWSRFVLAAIAMFVLDLLVRRVRLFDRKFVASARRARFGL